MDNKTYWSPQQIIKSGKYPFTMGMLRQLLLNREKNGLAYAIIKVGKRIIFRMDLFESWLDFHIEKNAPLIEEGAPSEK